jgi:hypothetical protein
MWLSFVWFCLNFCGSFVEYFLCLVISNHWKCGSSSTGALVLNHLDIYVKYSI